MTDTKFTSGEWSQSHRKDNHGMYSTEVYDDRGETICTLDWHTEPNSTATDRPFNAHLIAAAPDMYAMIKELAHELNIAIDECNEYRAKTINSSTESEPDYVDKQTVHEAQVLLSKARGG